MSCLAAALCPSAAALSAYGATLSPWLMPSQPRAGATASPASIVSLQDELQGQASDAWPSRGSQSESGACLPGGVDDGDGPGSVRARFHKAKHAARQPAQRPLLLLAARGGGQGGGEVAAVSLRSQAGGARGVRMEAVLHCPVLPCAPSSPGLTCRARKRSDGTPSGPSEGSSLRQGAGLSRQGAVGEQASAPRSLRLRLLSAAAHPRMLEALRATELVALVEGRGGLPTSRGCSSACAATWQSAAAAGRSHFSRGEWLQQRRARPLTRVPPHQGPGVGA